LVLLRSVGDRKLSVSLCFRALQGAIFLSMKN
jgi:hypothetical protein